MAWLNKGLTPDYVAQARNFFDRALTADPDNVEALFGSAWADVADGANYFVTDPMAAFAAAEAHAFENGVEPGQIGRVVAMPCAARLVPLCCSSPPIAPTCIPHVMRPGGEREAEAVAALDLKESA